MNYLMRSDYPNSCATNRLDDLVRVFYVLDDKPEPDHRIGIGSRLWQAYHAGETSLDTPYFHLKCFKKGSGHVTFKRLDLVEQMNKIVAKHFPHSLACEKQAPPSPRSIHHRPDCFQSGRFFEEN